jgi:hypothetical protein
MKALSIIGIVFSVLCFVIACSITTIKCYCIDGDNITRQPDVAVIPGIWVMVISLFFLAFSIVATVTSFRKKTA